MKPLFVLGKICATPSAAALEVDLGAYLHRHHCGDWGDGLGKEDKAANEAALRCGGRLLSCYSIGGREKICIATDPLRSITTIMLWDEL
jgi:hypothetical protein